MGPDLTSEAWAQMRHDYEHTDRPVEDICDEHGISSGTLRDRVRRWGWRRRRTGIPAEGPPPMPAPYYAYAPPRVLAAPAVDTAAPPLPAATPVAPSEDASEPAACDAGGIAPRLENAIARVLPAIEATVATLGAGPAHPREIERAARVLAALTRTLRELNTLLRERPEPAAIHPDDIPEDIDEFRRRLARRINAFVASRTGGAAEAGSASSSPPQPVAD